MRPFLLAIIVVLASLPGLAAAGPVVLSVSADHHVIVDLGAADGVGEGATLELLHEVVVKDPVTHETLRDVFPLGTMMVLRAGDHVAEAEPELAIATRVRIGDAVRLVSDEGQYADPWARSVLESRTPPPSEAEEPGVVVLVEPPPPPPSDDPAERREDAERAVADATAVRAVWQRTLGQPIPARIALWTQLLEADPGNQHAAAVRDEIKSLTRQAAEIDAARDAPPEDRHVLLAGALAEVDERAAGAGSLVAAPPTSARQGRAIELAFAVLDAAGAARGWIYARPVGTGGYQRLALRPDGDGYLRGAIPAAMVEAPGVEWYVETAAATGDPTAAIGSESQPRTVVVADVREPPTAQAGRSRVTASFDYVDFDGGLGGGFDQYTQAEIDFMYRFHRPVYAFRLGFGTLNGTGGPKDTIDEDPGNRCEDASGTYRCRKVSYSYTYVEAEFRIRPTVALMVRPQVGGLTTSDATTTSTSDCNTGEVSPACSIGKGVGLGARLRLGEDTGTNLALAIAVTSNVGTLFEAAYTWAAIPSVPVLLAVQVTNMPVPESFGVRLVADVGWRKHSWVYPSLRVSYQARDVDHAGFSGGLGLNFDW